MYIWYRIEDKMPPNKSHVLAVFKLRAAGLNEMQCMKLCYYDYTDGFNLKEEKCPYGTRIDHNVTHWMLRPELPPLEVE